MKLVNIKEIKKSIFLRTLIALSIIALFLIITIAVPLTNDLTQKNNQEVHFTVDAKMVSVNQFLSKIVNVAEQFTSRTQIRKKLEAYNRGEVSQQELYDFSHNKLLDAMKKSKDAYGITRLDIHGNIAVVVGKKVPDSFFKDFNKALQKTTIYNPIMIDNSLSIVIATPIFNRQKQRVGIDIVLFHTDTLKSIIQNYSGMGVTGETFIVYSKDHKNYQSFFNTRSKTNFTIISQLVNDFQKGVFKASDTEHTACKSYITTVRAIENSNWYLVFKIKKDELTSLIYDNTIRLIIIALIILIIGLFGVYLLTAPLMKNLEEDIQEIENVQHELNELNKELEKKVEDRTADLKVAKEKAESANRAKSMFLSNMSHELRTPLNAVLGFSQLMATNKELNKADQRNLRIINRSGQHLLQLINDVLDMSKIEAGKTTLELDNIDIGNLTNDVIDMMKIRAEAKGLHLILDQSSDFPRFIKTDGAKLRQIFINLLSNAIKFTEEGGVSLKLDTKQGDDESIILRCEVQDTGIGINEEDMKKIFMPFEQIVESMDQKGTGLGLAITKQFIELMGGEISVHSELGRGSKFYFHIKVEKAPDTAIIEQISKDDTKSIIGIKDPSKQWRILIAEDQMDNQLLLQQLLERVGFLVKIVANGKEAVEMFSEWKPHFIWMDIRMPVMNGLEATRQIKALPNGKETVITALTASIFKEQENEVMQAGCDDFIHKPYRHSEIYTCMAKHLDIEYLYEEVHTEETKAPAMNFNQMLEAMKKLDHNILNEIKKAAETFNDDRLKEIIENIDNIDSELSSSLKLKIEKFDFKTILNIIQKISDV